MRSGCPVAALGKGGVVRSFALQAILLGSITASASAQKREVLPSAPLAPPSLELRHTIRSPTRLALDADGNVYVTDTSVGSIFILDPTLRPCKELQITGVPLGIAVDSSAYLYVGRRERGAVTVFDAVGRELFELGNGRGEFALPNDIAVGPAGRLYVADSLQDCIKVYDTHGRRLLVIGRSGTGEGTLSFPSCIAVDPVASELYVGDQGNHRIQVFTLDGRWLRSFGGPVTHGSFNGRFSCIQSLALEQIRDEDVLVHVVDTTQNRIQILTARGAHKATYGETGRAPGQLYLPLDIAWDPMNGILACNNGNHRVELVRRP